jgi:hypothetical protein
LAATQRASALNMCGNDTLASATGAIQAVEEGSESWTIVPVRTAAFSCALTSKVRSGERLSSECVAGARFQAAGRLRHLGNSYLLDADRVVCEAYKIAPEKCVLLERTLAKTAGNFKGVQTFGEQDFDGTYQAETIPVFDETPDCWLDNDEQFTVEPLWKCTWHVEGAEKLAPAYRALRNFIEACADRNLIAGFSYEELVVEKRSEAQETAIFASSVKLPGFGFPGTSPEIPGIGEISPNPEGYRVVIGVSKQAITKVDGSRGGEVGLFFQHRRP